MLVEEGWSNKSAAEVLDCLRGRWARETRTVPASSDTKGVIRELNEIA